ncbi:hypothetical protein [Achromobacter insolitus]|uniref:hypothetical protein n=1 Tax=Achromobacter insolitus TaxID=217204 RepID=UPI002FE3BB33
MAQPPAYNRQKDFGADYGDQTDNQAINNELDSVSKSVNAIRDNLAKIQRDDGGLATGIVTEDSLNPVLKDALYDEFSGNVNDAVLEAQQAAAEANTAAIAAEDARDVAQSIANSFGDLNAARAEWESAVITSEAAALAAGASASSAAVDAARAEAGADAAALAGRVFDTPTLGIAGTTSGQYFSVPASDAQDSLILYQNVSGTAVERKRYPSSLFDALTANRGKPYPLRVAVRAGVVSPEMTPFSNLLLAATVYGAEPGKVYRIGYQRNEAAVAGSYPYGWVLEEHNEADYETTDAGFVLIHHYTDPAPNIIRTGGIQTFFITPVQRPLLRFKITVDAAQLPPAGVSIDAQSGSSRPGWSWIVDTSCYVRAMPVQDDSMSINSGKPFPLRVANRGGVTSAAHGQLNDLLLDVRVINGDATKLYRVAYQQNGAVLGGVSEYDWIIEEFDAASYETSPVATVIMSYTDAQYGPQEQITRTGGIQTVRLYPPSRPGLRIEITCDASKLPPVGTPVNAYTSNANAGWSWVVHPSCVDLPRSSGPQSIAWNYVGIWWTYTANNGGTFAAVWRSGSRLYRVEFGPKGPNSIPDIRRVLRAPLGDPAVATWTTIVDNATGGDWTGPFVVEAVSGGDGSTTKIYTGGNHGSDGGTGGTPTGRNTAFVVMADGAPVAAGSSGVSSSIKILSINEVMAYNTASLGRYVMRETCRYDIYPGLVGLKKHVQALESVNVLQDNGPQTFTVGYQAGTFIYYGKANARGAFTSTTSSGAKSSFPNVWAVVFQDSTNGQLAAWMDRTFEIGDGRHVKSTAPLIRGGGAGNTKFYHAAVVDDTGVPLAAGAAYEWRGGWAWQQMNAVSANLDSSLTFNRGDERAIAEARATGETIIV